MEINCEQVVEKYLLNQNALYAFSFPLAILISIIVFGIVKAYKISDNSYVNQILIPILTFLLTMVLIDVIARLMISKKEQARLIEMCKLWMHEPSVKNHPILSKMIDMDLVSNYKVENFSSGRPSIQDNLIHNNLEEDQGEQVKNKILQEKKNISVENVEVPFDSIKGLFPEPIEYKKYTNSQCIEPSNDCNICSGTGNTMGLIAPIPGPQWLPRSAEAVQNSLKNNEYTKGSC
jgi:hypothetical protein